MKRCFIKGRDANDPENLFGDLPADIRDRSGGDEGAYRTQFDLFLHSEGPALYNLIKNKSSSSREQKRSADKLQLEAFLIKHHGYGTGSINWEPATQKIIQNIFNWNQSKVSRVMKLLFGEKPMQKYKQLCRGRVLKGFIKKHDNGTSDIEAISDPTQG
ncbi:hypothetical protein ACFL5Z_17385 [Planctomycetota bacterium]